jgi:hypothetical protein
MMKRGCMLVLSALALVGLDGSAASAQVPALVPLHGVLSDAQGQPARGELQIVFSVYADAKGGTPLYSETHSVKTQDGRFSVMLGDHKPLDPGLFAEHTDLFLGVRVEQDDEATPRMQLGSVPFAAAAGFAHEAATLTGIDAHALQRRVIGSCSSGEAMVAITDDGNVRCERFVGEVGPSGPPGPPGAEGTPGPKGDPGDLGPATHFDCMGLAVTSVDKQGRPTCVPLASVNVRAGPGLTQGGCQGNTCDLSVAPDAIGMKQVNLPMGSDNAHYDQIFNGPHFYQAGNDFVPDSDGHCLILSSIETVDTNTATDGALATDTLEIGVGYTEDGVPGTAAPELRAFATLRRDGTATASAFHHVVVPVTSGKTYRFGCTVNASGMSWVNKGIWCQVSRFCQ